MSIYKLWVEKSIIQYSSTSENICFIIIINTEDLKKCILYVFTLKTLKNLNNFNMHYNYRLILLSDFYLAPWRSQLSFWKLNNLIYLDTTKNNRSVAISGFMLCFIVGLLLKIIMLVLCAKFINLYFCQWVAEISEIHT